MVQEGLGDNFYHKCRFTDDEAGHLHSLATKGEYVRFPRWTISLCIFLFTCLFTSQVAIWMELGSKTALNEMILMRDRMTKIESTIPNKFPPDWFQDQFKLLSERVESNGELLHELRIEIKGLKEKHASEK